jgi:tellurite resistance protein
MSTSTSSSKASRAPVTIGASLLAQASFAYALRPSYKKTVPTGFDPIAATIFEAVVDACYLVATADGVFDDQERLWFVEVVRRGCEERVTVADIELLVDAMTFALEQEGAARRVEVVACSLPTTEQREETLRFAAATAAASGGVAAAERAVLEALSENFGLPSSALEMALAAVASV